MPNFWATLYVCVCVRMRTCRRANSRTNRPVLFVVRVPFVDRLQDVDLQLGRIAILVHVSYNLQRHSLARPRQPATICDHFFRRTFLLHVDNSVARSVCLIACMTSSILTLTLYTLVYIFCHSRVFIHCIQLYCVTWDNYTLQVGRYSVVYRCRLLIAVLLLLFNYVFKANEIYFNRLTTDQ